jgi:uncharacterized protein (TIGR00290 family)
VTRRQYVLVLRWPSSPAELAASELALASSLPPAEGSVALAWSGGKDSALALDALRRGGVDVAALMTTVTLGYDRVSMHGVRRDLVRRQAVAAGLPLVELEIPPSCTNAVYEARLARALASPPLDTLAAFAFGDLLLEDVRSDHEDRLSEAGRRSLFPLWGRDTAELAREFVETGFEAVVCCVDPRRLDTAFAGRAYDKRFLSELPADVDPCGENGEFHTFVWAGPVFAESLPLQIGPVVERDGFVFCDLVRGAERPPCRQVTCAILIEAGSAASSTAAHTLS